MIKMKEFIKPVLILILLYSLIFVLVSFGIEQKNLLSLAFFTWAFSTLYFGYKFSDKFDFVPAIRNVLLLILMSIMPIYIIGILLEGLWERLFEYLKILLVISFLSILFGAIGYLLNKQTKKIKFLKKLTIPKKFINWRTVALLSILIFVYLIIIYQTIELIFFKKVPVDVYKQYASAKSQYGNGGYYKLSECASIDNKTYYEIKSGFYGISNTNIKNESGGFVCSWGWVADCRDRCFINTSGCPEFEKCTLIAGKSLD